MVVLSLQWLATESEWAAKRLADAAASDHVFPVRRYLDNSPSPLGFTITWFQYQELVIPPFKRYWEMSLTLFLVSMFRQPVNDELEHVDHLLPGQCRRVLLQPPKSQIVKLLHVTDLA